MKRLIIGIIMGIGLFLSNGCVPVYIGAGLVSGYLLSNDSATGTINAEYRKVWDTCKEVLDGLRSEIIEANESKGIIKARISDRDITIRIDSIAQDKQRLKVSVRKYLLPKLEYAQQIFFKIVKELE